MELSNNRRMQNVRKTHMQNATRNGLSLNSIENIYSGKLQKQRKSDSSAEWRWNNNSNRLPCCGWRDILWLTTGSTEIRVASNIDDEDDDDGDGDYDDDDDDDDDDGGDDDNNDACFIYSFRK